MIQSPRVNAVALDQEKTMKRGKRCVNRSCDGVAASPRRDDGEHGVVVMDAVGSNSKALFVDAV